LPKLSNFGQTFRDNGYQLNNDRDAPIYQNPAYWPITFRATPNWHRESNDRAARDIVAGDPNSGRTETTITQSGFDLNAWTSSRLERFYKNIHLPSSQPWTTAEECTSIRCGCASIIC